MNEEPAPRLSIAEYMTVARFDKAPAAPESFDATAAVRRVLALVASWDELHTTDSLGGRVFRHCAGAIRDAVDGLPK